MRLLREAIDDVEVPSGSPRDRVHAVVHAGWQAFSNPASLAAFEILVATRAEREPWFEGHLADLGRASWPASDVRSIPPAEDDGARQSATSCGPRCGDLPWRRWSSGSRWTSVTSSWRWSICSPCTSRAASDDPWPRRPCDAVSRQMPGDLTPRIEERTMIQPVDTPEQQYKVVVWATGRVGKLAIRTIADRPNLDLVGVWVHSESKEGQDAGALAGIDPLGVISTRDQEAILAGRRGLRRLHRTGDQPATGGHGGLLPHPRGRQEHRDDVTARAGLPPRIDAGISLDAAHGVGGARWQLDLLHRHRTRVRL